MMPLKKLKKRYLLLGVVFAVIILALGGTAFHEWAMAGGNVELAISGARQVKNGSIAIQVFILFAVWWFWEEWIVSRVPECRKEAVAKKKNGTCAAVAIMLFLIWLT